MGRVSRAATAAFLLVCLTHGADSRPSYATRIPNGVSVPAPDGSGAICNGVGHDSCYGAGPLNPFGQAFEAASLQWTVELCQADSDGDGLTNGQELGDPCCTWTPGAAPLQNAALSHPGFAESVADITAQASINCEDQPAASPLEGSSKFYNIGEEQSSQTFTMEWDLSTQETQYIAFPRALKYDDQAPTSAIYMVGFKVEVDNIEHVHHFVVYQCDRELTEEELQPFDELTEENYSRRNDMGCQKEIAIWAPGLDEVIYPSDVAVPLGPGTANRAILIQVHYNNPENVPGVVDTSMLTFYYTPLPREHDMAFLQLGDVLLFTQNEIPPGQSSWHVTHRCLIQTNEELTVFQHAPHMHFNGRRLWSEKIATGGGVGADGKWDFANRAEANGQPLELIGRTDSFDYNLQRPYDLENTFLSNGDLVSTSCVYNTQGKNETVRGGLGSQDEMCIHFLSVYPAAALERNYCIQEDPALAGEWPSENFSVTDDPDMLAKMLSPNPNIELGYDNLSSPPLDFSEGMPKLQPTAEQTAEPRVEDAQTDGTSNALSAQPRLLAAVLALAALLMALH